MVGLLPGYLATLCSEASNERYREKLKLVNGMDPYEVEKRDWTDD